MATVPPRIAFININPLNASSPPKAPSSTVLARLRQASPTGSQALHSVFSVRTEISASDVRDSEYSLHAPPSNDVAWLDQPYFLGASLQPNDARIVAPMCSQVPTPPRFKTLDRELEVKANTALMVSTPKYPRRANANWHHHYNQQPQQSLTSMPTLAQLKMPQSESALQFAREIQQKTAAALMEESGEDRPVKRQRLNGNSTSQPPKTSANSVPDNTAQPQTAPPSVPITTYRALLPPNPVPTENSQSISQSILPSFLQYVDSHLMRTFDKHNHPPSPTEQCICCGWQHDLSPIASTFVPLGCGHWLHYRCLVWNACQLHENKDACPHCSTKLFEWDGMNVLTVATRTIMELQDHKWPTGAKYWDLDVKMVVASDKEEYEAECWAIETCISTMYHHMVPQSRYGDGSQDVTKMYYDTIDALKGMGRPRAKWLRWRTYTGYLLFGILVAQKVRRWLGEVHPEVRGTEGWTEFEEGSRGLQRRLLAEVGKLER